MGVRSVGSTFIAVNAELVKTLPGIPQLTFGEIQDALIFEGITNMLDLRRLVSK
jgi:hypothetical protein